MEKLQTIIEKVLDNKGKKPTKPLSESTSLREDLSFDSFDLAELTVRIESEFGVDVFEDGPVYTVGEILKKIGNA